MSMQRRDKMLGDLDIGNLIGVEIGPLAFPLVRKLDGDITYVDFTDSESLREKYLDDGAVPLHEIVEVDAIWGSNTLLQAIDGRLVDYVIASHVIEHIPDLLAWLSELCSILKPTGHIRLAVPDKRYCFDYLRRETEIADVLSAYLTGARMPQPQQILDFILNYVDIDRVAAWDGTLDPESLRCNNSITSALDLARESIQGKYIDVHCWVFTPRSLGSLFARLAHDGLIKMECVQFHDTAYGEHEFFIGLHPCNDREQAVRSWEKVRDLAQETKVDPKQDEINALKSQLAGLKYDGKIVQQPAANRGRDDGWYLVKDGKRSWIPNSVWLAKNGYQENEVIEISSVDFNAIPEEPYHKNDH